MFNTLTFFCQTRQPLRIHYEIQTILRFLRGLGYNIEVAS
jgi:hypothetical protein